MDDEIRRTRFATERIFQQMYRAQALAARADDELESRLDVVMGKTRADVEAILNRLARLVEEIEKEIVERS